MKPKPFMTALRSKLHKILNIALQWGAAALGGALANMLNVPLAWTLGPLIVTAGLSISGTMPYAPVEARRLGQLIIGMAIGLNMTPDAAEKLLTWLPIMVLSALVSIFLAALFTNVVARKSHIDSCSAYFALLPGGMTEMANVGQRLGARAEAISLAHALRVALTVLIVPWAVIMIDGQTDFGFNVSRTNLSLPMLAFLTIAALSGAFALHKVRFTNPWMLGSLAAVGFLVGMGLVEGKLPVQLLWIGQFFIGMAVGERFKRDILRRLPRLALISSIALIAMSLIMAGFAAIIQRLGTSDLESLVLAVSPGGFAEMTLTAQMLHLDVALVTGFHFARAFAVNSLAAPLWHLLKRIGWCNHN
jgi:uncharacterized protein